MEEKYNFPPKSDCRFCKGTGKRYVEKHDQDYPCICLFVDHRYCEEMGLQLSETAKKIKQEMFG